MGILVRAVTIDCRDAAGLACFWAEVLAGRVRDAGNGYVAVRHGGDGTPELLFQPVRDRPTGRNRLHLDLAAPDPGAEVARVAGLGATLVEQRSDSLYIWWVMADPEGNLFCVG